MLLIDNKQVSVEGFISKIEEISGKKIPLDQIKKNMEFQYNQAVSSIDYAQLVHHNRKVHREKKGDDVLASFRVFSDVDNQSVDFRFANRMPYSDVSRPNVLIYDPKAVEISGGINTLEPRDIERCVYLYCHPLCYDSPFYKSGSVYKYSHINVKAESIKLREEMNAKNKAYMHATNVDSMEIKALAKGLGITVLVDDDSTDIRIKLQDFAMNNSKKYLEKIQTETVKFEGMIQDAIDTGFITKSKNGEYVTWSFSKGRRAGNTITTISEREGGDVVHQLKTYMKEHIQDYYNDMSILNTDVNANMRADEFLKSIKKGAALEHTEPYNEAKLLSSVVDYKSSLKYLAELHPEKGQPSPSNAKKFLELVLEGEINDGNVADEAKKYAKQS